MAAAGLDVASACRIVAEISMGWRSRGEQPGADQLLELEPIVKALVFERERSAEMQYAIGVQELTLSHSTQLRNEAVEARREAEEALRREQLRVMELAELLSEADEHNVVMEQRVRLLEYRARQLCVPAVQCAGYCYTVCWLLLYSVLATITQCAGYYYTACTACCLLL